MPNTSGRFSKWKKGGVLPIFFIAIILIAVILIGVFLLWPGQQGPEFLNPFLFPLEYEELIYRYSELYDLDPYLVMGLIRAESSFISDAVSPVGARGLMQIMPNTAEWLAEDRMGINFHVDDLFNPAYNIRMGTYYLRLLLNMFEEQDTALAAYNAGMGNVGNWLQDERYSADGRTLHTIPFSETRYYVPRVNRYMEIYRELYGTQDEEVSP